MFEEEKEQYAIREIKEAASYYISQQYEVRKQQKIKDLLYENYISTVKSLATIYDSIGDLIPGAQQELDESLTPKEGSRLELITRRIKDDFVRISPIIITKIIREGRSVPYLYHIFFKFDETDKIEYCIDIPCKKNLSITNFELANYGKFSFGVVEGAKIKELFASYSISEISNFIDEYFKEGK